MQHAPLVLPAPAGLYCPAGDFYIDPKRGVDLAVVTHAHADHARPGSRRYIAARRGASLLRERLGRIELDELDYGVPVRLGRAWVSLHSAGHILGSAQVRIEVDGEVWVVSGDYKRDADPTCDPFEVVPCDVFITEATFALPVYRWPPSAQVARAVLDWWRSNGDRPSVLLGYSLGKTQRLLAELGRLTDRPALLHPSAEAATTAYRSAGIDMLPTERLTEASDPSGALVIAPPAALQGPAMRRWYAHASTAFASGWMALRAQRRSRRHERGFVLSDHADWPALVRTARETGARRVYAMHGDSRALVRYLREEYAIDAAPLEALAP